MILDGSKLVMRYLHFLVVLVFCWFSPAFARELSVESLIADQRLAMKNEVLSKVKGQPITTLDICKYMDRLFDRNYTVEQNPFARHQFYVTYWQDCLEQLERRALVLLDAEEKKMESSFNDIREWLSDEYGAGARKQILLQNKRYNEVWQEAKKESLYFQILAGVRFRAMQNVTPKMVFEAYEQSGDRFLQDAMWEYHIVSIEAEDNQQCREICQAFVDRFHQGASLEETVASFSDFSDGQCSVLLSPLYRLEERALSQKHREMLFPLQIKSLSSGENSLQDNQKTVKLFFLHNHTPAYKKPYSVEIENQLRCELLSIEREKKEQEYFEQLQSRFQIERVSNGDPCFYLLY